MEEYSEKEQPETVPEPERGGRWVDMVEEAAFGGPEDPRIGRLSIMRTLDEIERNPERLKRLEENAEAMTPGITRIKLIEEADSFLYDPLTQSIYNWSGDYEMELYNAGLENKMYFRTRVQYCWEFCLKFPESDESIICKMLQSEAESWGAWGKIHAAELNFRKLIKKFPENTWAYAAWGDLYSNDRIYRDYDKSDYSRAEEIYRLGLERCDADLYILEDRIKGLSEQGVDE